MIIPSIDLKNKKAVQLEKGKKEILKKDNIFELAEKFNRFSEIAVIDLDRAIYGKNINKDIVKKLCQHYQIRVGGGLNSPDNIKEVYSWGADKIIVGSSVFKKNIINYSFLKEIKKIIGKNRIVIALDIKDKKIAINGWKKKINFDLEKAVQSLENYCSEFLITSVNDEGLLKGANYNLYKKLKKITDKKITAAGGINSLNEIKKLSKDNFNIQIGMALYKNIFSVEDAFIESLNWEKQNLIPAVVKDEKGQILMQAYMNKKSLRKTFEKNKMCYYSRSRKKLWIKGETSGNYQKFLKVRTDCDRDSLLFTVKQTNKACHLDQYSCFNEKKFFLKDLIDRIKERIKLNPRDSYTANLTDEKLHEKLIEEINELITSNSRSNRIWEAADILYFLLVYLEKNNIDIEVVKNELKRRFRS